MTKEAKILIEIIDGITNWHDYWGKEIFRLETQTGLPKGFILDILDNKVKLTNMDLCRILIIYQQLSADHRIKSGMQEKSLKKLQRHNVEELMQTYERGLII